MNDFDGDTCDETRAGGDGTSQLTTEDLRDAVVGIAGFVEVDWQRGQFVMPQLKIVHVA